MDKLKAVIAHGADAVYAGVHRHSLRSREYNFNFESLKEAVAYTKKHQKKFYLALNIFCRDRDLEDINGYLPQIREVCPDAVIISDPGLFSLFRESCPELPVIVSTQANVLNISSARDWETKGAFRITLARELKLDEITAISKELKAETEVFIHGSLCLAYAGSCLLSGYLHSREANRGHCTQPCRFSYFLKEEKSGTEIKLDSDCDTTYLLSSKDLCLAGLVPELIRGGVSSFKIEGRNRSLYYAASATSFYRRLIDRVMCEKERFKFGRDYRDELEKIPHRAYTESFTGGEAWRRVPSKRASGCDWEMTAIIKENGSQMTAADIKSFIIKDELLEAVEPGLVPRIVKVTDIHTFPERKKADEAIPGGLAYLTFEEKMKPYTLLRRKKR